MHMVWRVTRLAALLVLAASVADAQDKRRVALDFGYPPAFAVLWHASESLVLRPDVTFVHIGGDNASTWRFGIGGSALFPVRQQGSLTTYFGPRVGYSWYSESDSPTEWSIAGIFGARFSLDKGLGISAETGIVYDKIHVPGSPFGGNENTLSPWGRVSALLYF
jgi:hypothetical protein